MVESLDNPHSEGVQLTLHAARYHLPWTPSALRSIGSWVVYEVIELAGTSGDSEWRVFTGRIPTAHKTLVFAELADDHRVFDRLWMRGTGALAFALKQKPTHSATIPKIAKNATNIIAALTLICFSMLLGLWLYAVTVCVFLQNTINPPASPSHYA
jgi:hypothetical protein